MLWVLIAEEILLSTRAGRGSSIGSVFAWHANRPEFDPWSGTFFRGDLVMKIFLRPFYLFR